ncbi:hypothetical protein D3C85_1415450 [compost metagenome]
MGGAGVACRGHAARFGPPLRHPVNTGSILIARLPLVQPWRVVDCRRGRGGIVSSVLQSQILLRCLSLAAGDSTGGR